MGEIAFSRASLPIFVHKIFLASPVAIPRPPIKTSRVEAAATFAKLGQTSRKRKRKRQRTVRERERERERERRGERWYDFGGALEETRGHSWE